MIATASSVPVSTSRITFCATTWSLEPRCGTAFLSRRRSKIEGAGGERAAAPGSHPGSSNRRALVLHARRTERSGRDDAERASHHRRVRIAPERVLAGLELDGPDAFADSAHRRGLVDARAFEMEVVDRRLVLDLDSTRAGLHRLHLCAGPVRELDLVVRIDLTLEVERLLARGGVD